MNHPNVYISPLEVLVLKKMVLVNHALSQKITGAAGIEQLGLTKVLNDIVLRADLANHMGDRKAVWQGLTTAEWSLLKSVSVLPQPDHDTIEARVLVNHGLVKRADPGELHITANGMSILKTRPEGA